MKRLDSLEASYRCCWWGFWIFIALLIVGWLTSCTTTKVVTVPEVHEKHHWHTDSVIKRDSVIRDRQTTIREVDSATMAQYGIRLDKAQRAWLIQTDRLQREIERLQSVSNTRDTVRDSVSVPYPVEVTKEVPMERGKMEWVLILAGCIAIVVVFLWIVNKLKGYLPFMRY